MTRNRLSEEEIFKKLKETIVDFLQVVRDKDTRGDKYEIAMKTDIYDDLAIDSLEAMDLIGAIEKKFELPLKAEELILKKRIFEIVEYLSKAMS